MKVMLKNVRLAFPRVFEPQSGPDGGDPKFSATLILEDSANREKIDKAIEEVASEKWQSKGSAVLKKLRSQNRTCHKDGDEKADYDGFDGTTFVSASNKAAPSLFDRDGSRLEQRDGKPYAGCYVDASIEVWAQDNKFGKRVNAQLRGLKFTKDGKAFAGGGVASEDDFEFDAGDGEDAEDLI